MKEFTMRAGALFLIVVLTSLAAGAPPPEKPIGLWKFDGDGRDAATPAHDAALSGKIEYRASPLNDGNGKALWLNGVDTAARIDGLPALNAGAGADAGKTAGHSLSLWICPLELRPCAIASRQSNDAGWSLQMTPQRGVRLSAGGKAIETPGDRLDFGQWTHVAITLDAAGHAVLYLDGAQAAQGELGGGAIVDAPLRLGSTEKASLFTGLLDEVRADDVVLDAEQVGAITDSGLPWLRVRPSDAQPFAGKFVPRDNDVIAWVGGEDTVAAGQVGYLETLLSAGSDKRLFFRDMAWEGDTASAQGRVFNFGPWRKQFDRAGVSVIFVQFGKMESLDGSAGLAAFTAAYDRLLDEFSARTHRIVLVAPTPFEKTAPPAPDLSAHNADLALYAQAIRKLAERRGLLFVDLNTPFAATAAEHAMTRDGVHLNAYGQLQAARETARQLGFSSTDPATNEPLPGFERKELESLRQTIVAKNVLWNRYWRPLNWAFLNGDRTNQASSRDHLDGRIRWLPAEVEEYSAQIAHQDAQTAAQAKALRQK